MDPQCVTRQAPGRRAWPRRCFSPRRDPLTRPSHDHYNDLHSICRLRHIVAATHRRARLFRHARRDGLPARNVDHSRSAGRAHRANARGRRTDLVRERSASTAAARERSSQADARVAQRRSELLPNLSTSAQVGTRSFNTASLGIDFPTAPGGSRGRSRWRGAWSRAQHRHARAHHTTTHQRPIRVELARDGDGLPTPCTTAPMLPRTPRPSAVRTRICGCFVQRRASRRERRIRRSPRSCSILRSSSFRPARELARRHACRVTTRRCACAPIATRGDRDRGVLQLRHELALADAAPLVIADSLRAAVAERRDGTEERSFGRRSTIAQTSRRRVTQSEGARMHARAAVAERLPSVSLYADHGSNGKETERMLGTYSYGVQVSLPIFDGLRLESKMRRSVARAARGRGAGAGHQASGGDRCAHGDDQRRARRARKCGRAGAARPRGAGSRVRRASGSVRA